MSFMAVFNKNRQWLYLAQRLRFYQPCLRLMLYQMHQVASLIVNYCTFRSFKTIMIFNRFTHRYKIAQGKEDGFWLQKAWILIPLPLIQPLAAHLILFEPHFLQLQMHQYLSQFVIPIRLHAKVTTLFNKGKILVNKV